MTLFVTGIGSFIGSALKRAAAARGIAVVGVDARPANDGGWHQADIRDPAIADLMPENADAVVHLAALSRDADCRGQGQACFDVNVMGTLNLVAAARARGARQFVFASSEWVYDSFAPGAEKTEDAAIDAAKLTSEYALSKLVSENNLRQQAAHGSCPATVLRFGIVYGPRRDNWSAVEALLNAVATHDEVTIGARATARRFIHVADVADGVLAALGWPRAYDVFNIQGPALVTLGDVVDAASGLVGRAPRIVETAPDAPSIRAVSNRKAAVELGWTAETSLRDGLADVARHLGLVPPRPDAMELRPRALAGLFDVVAPRLPDERGFLYEPYQASDFAGAGFTPHWNQVIQSHTDRSNTVRGLYIQLPPFAEGKLVSSLRGETWWVVADMRPDSPTFARWEGTHLRPGDAVLIARGFAHGCLSLSDDADLLLLADNAHARAQSVGIAWDDPDLAIDWPLKDAAPIISEAHAAYPPFAQVRETIRSTLVEVQ